MVGLRTVVFELILVFVRVCKSVESFFLRCFPTIVKKQTNQIFKEADVIPDGTRPWDVRIIDQRFYHELATYVSQALGETYMKGWWECDDLEELSYHLFRKNLFKHVLTANNRFYMHLMYRTVNLQVKSRAREVAQKHYDLGNELFKTFLDPTMNYSCGYWRNADNLNQAQLDKMNLIARKLKLKPGMRVLDIGSGWGGLSKYLAENYGVEVVGYNISVEQIKYSRELCKGLKVEIRDADYRDINEKFDRIVSVGMFEHVGEPNYRTFFEIAHRCLTDDGIFLLHTIGVNHAGQPLTEPFTHIYIFPNGQLPYHRHITKYTEGLFIIEDWHNFGHDYSRTLRAWYNNFVNGWHKISDKYGEEFYRMWIFYLRLGAGAFRARRFHTWQIVLSKDGLEGGYLSER